MCWPSSFCRSAFPIQETLSWQLDKMLFFDSAKHEDLQHQTYISKWSKGFAMICMQTQFMTFNLCTCHNLGNHTVSFTCGGNWNDI